MIKLEVTPETAVALIQAALAEQKGYTTDPTCCPQRIVNLRHFINDLDGKLTEYLKEATLEEGKEES